MGLFFIFAAALSSLALLPVWASPDDTTQSQITPAESKRNTEGASIATQDVFKKGKQNQLCHWWELYVWIPDYVVIHMEAEGQARSEPQVISTEILRKKSLKEKVKNVRNHPKPFPSDYLRVHHLFYRPNSHKHWRTGFLQKFIRHKHGQKLDDGEIAYLPTPVSDIKPLKLKTLDQRIESFEKPTHIELHLESKLASTGPIRIGGSHSPSETGMNYKVTHHIYYFAEGIEILKMNNGGKKINSHPNHDTISGAGNDSKLSYRGSASYKCDRDLIARPYVVQKKQRVYATQSMTVPVGRSKGPKTTQNMLRW